MRVSQVDALFFLPVNLILYLEEGECELFLQVTYSLYKYIFVYLLK